ncbi:MAG: hypothetical protein FWD70_02915 [Desulfuromonadales bacterium]|nr:hypothetical protein [Desulfuromonadales bacterium]
MASVISESENLKKSLLLIIDPQNDFVLPTGTLPVKGAEADMERLVKLIDSKPLFDKIVITLDTHHPVHIASPCYWQDKNGQNPAPFKSISYDELSTGIWKPVYNKTDAAIYLQELEKRGKKHIIWPPHCLYATSGWGICDTLYNALQRWHIATGREFILYTKGEESQSTEMFSAVRPEVSLDRERDKNKAESFYRLISGYDAIYIAGEAEDFCVKETVSSIMADKPELMKKVVILKDTMAAIFPDSPELKEFWNKVRVVGGRISDTETECKAA